MTAYSAELIQLAEELFDEAELARLRQVAETHPLDVAQVLAFDRSLGGPSMLALTRDGRSQYTRKDEGIFRPLQYCDMHFEAIYVGNQPEWQARAIVHFSSLHLEGLVKRIGEVPHFPLGMALRQKIAKRRIHPDLWQMVDRYNGVYTASKHDFSHEMDTHLFSLQDAVFAYFVCRRLGGKLYPLANLSTDLALLEREGGDPQERLQEWEPWRRTFNRLQEDDSDSEETSADEIGSLSAFHV